MRKVVLAFLLMIAAVSAGFAETPSGMPLIALTIQGKDGATKADLTVELAETPAHRAKGLMFRTELADNRGMLFDFKETRSVSMWMKNTPLSLDMIFTDAKGTVVYIARNTVPYSEDIISPGVPVYAVLEVKAGIADKRGIDRGDRFVSPVFK